MTDCKTGSILIKDAGLWYISWNKYVCCEEWKKSSWNNSSNSLYILALTYDKKYNLLVATYTKSFILIAQHINSTYTCLLMHVQLCLITFQYHFYARVEISYGLETH